MGNFLKGLVVAVAICAAIAAIVAFTTGLGLATKAVVAPISTRIDNSVFHESQQYNDTMGRDVDEYRHQWLTASPEGRDVILNCPGLAASVQDGLTHHDDREHDTLVIAGRNGIEDFFQMGVCPAIKTHDRKRHAEFHGADDDSQPSRDCVTVSGVCAHFDIPVI